VINKIKINNNKKLYQKKNPKIHKNIKKKNKILWKNNIFKFL